MTNAEFAAALEELGVLYELDGAVRYRVLAYSTAAKAIRESPVSVEELAAKGRATEIPGVGKTIAEKIDALIAEGEIPAAAKLKAKFPPTLIEVTKKREREEDEEEIWESEVKEKMEKREKESKNITAQVTISIEKGLVIQKEKEELKRKREEAAPIKLFGLDFEDEDISETDSDVCEEIIQKSKRHCSSNINSTTSTELTINT